MEEIIIIDRFEGEYALCEKENRQIIAILKANMPKGIKIGDYIRANFKENIFIIEKSLTLEAKKRAIELTRAAFEE